MMFFPKRSQAYPIACGLCWSPLGGWASWYGWLGCGEHKKLGPHLSKCPDPPSAADGARGHVRTTLKSTVSSAHCSNDHWDSLVTQPDQIYSWEAPVTALLYTLLHMRARSKVGSEVQQAPSVAASSASPAALPAVLPPSGPPVRAERPALRLSCASRRPRRPSGGLNPPDGGGGRAARQPSSIGPPETSPKPPNVASLALASVVVMIGEVCAVLRE